MVPWPVNMNIEPDAWACSLSLRAVKKTLLQALASNVTYKSRNVPLLFLQILRTVLAISFRPKHFSYGLMHPYECAWHIDYTFCAGLTIRPYIC